VAQVGAAGLAACGRSKIDHPAPELRELLALPGSLDPPVQGVAD